MSAEVSNCRTVSVLKFTDPPEKDSLLKVSSPYQKRDFSH